MKTKMIGVAALAAALTAGEAFAQGAGAAPGGGRDFLKDQAVAEMQRVSNQVDMLANNQEEQSARLRKAESQNQALKEEVKSLGAEIAALKGAIAELRREMQAQRGEIVQDLSKKIASMQPPAPAPSTRGGGGGGSSKPRPAYTGPVYEYTVQSGDTLSLIAKAFGSTVQKIKDLNGMKSDALRVGQKINIPKE